MSSCCDKKDTCPAPCDAASCPASSPATAASAGHVVIVGSGCAGLYAANLLKEQGFEVTIVEAADYIGGRLKQMSGFVPWKIDLGAEYLHGSIDSIPYDWLVKKLGTRVNYTFDLDTDRTTVYCYHQGKLVPFADPTQEVTKIAYYIDKLKEDSALLASNNYNLSVLEYMRNSGLPSHLEGLVDSLLAKTNGSCMSSLSAREIAREDMFWHYGSDNFRPARSYAPMVEDLVAPIRDRIHINWPVRRITIRDSAENDRHVVEVESRSGAKIQADYALVTVPLPILRDGDIEFDPPMPSAKVDACRSVNMEGAMKVVCRFSEKFWPEKLQLVLCETCPFAQVWFDGTHTHTADEMSSTGSATAAADDDDPITPVYTGTAFVIGNHHSAVSDWDEEAIVKAFLAFLDRMFGVPVHRNSVSATPTDELEDPSAADVFTTPATAAFRGAITYDWTKNPFVRGGYTTQNVGVNEHIRAAIAAPFGRPGAAGDASEYGSDMRVFFAGEHTHHSYVATVQTAMESGERAAVEIATAQSVRKLEKGFRNIVLKVRGGEAAVKK